MSFNYFSLPLLCTNVMRLPIGPLLSRTVFLKVRSLDQHHQDLKWGEVVSESCIFIIHLSDGYIISILYIISFRINDLEKRRQSSMSPFHFRLNFSTQISLLIFRRVCFSCSSSKTFQYPLELLQNENMNNLVLP